MLAGIRFYWNATRGHHLAPWRSEYIRWRIETYSGMHAGDIDASKFFGFLVKDRARLMHFLLWTIRMDRLSGERNAPH